MAITNVFRVGGGGEPSDFPAEKIILSGEDLTSFGYMDLENNLVLDKADAPELWEIYNTGPDVFTILAIASPSVDKKWWIFIE